MSVYAEYAALHNVSLLLWGNDINLSRSTSPATTEKDADFQSSDPMPDDELTNCMQTKSIINKVQGEATGIELIMKPQEDKGVVVLVDEISSRPDEARWRSHGLERRRKILNIDKRNGGRNFSLSFDCSVQRYFSVAQGALEQFHELYQKGSSEEDQNQLEELYVMGFRIISFLTQCLPKHPGLSGAPLVKDRTKKELSILAKCLDDVALRIDECICNHFVDDGDIFLDSVIASQLEEEDVDEENRSLNGSQAKNHNVMESENWFNFDHFNKLERKLSRGAKQQERKLSESPTSETIGTTGTDSLGPNDTMSNASVDSNNGNEGLVRRVQFNDKSKITDEEPEEDYSYDDDRVIRDDDTFDIHELADLDDLTMTDDLTMASYSSQPFKLLRKSVSLDFLKTIACEPVIFETDSDAADSWANGEDSNSKAHPCLPSSSGVTPTSDPARIAFRSLMNKIPHKHILRRDKHQTLSSDMSSFSTSSSPDPSRSSSPTFSDIMEERDTGLTSTFDDESLDQIVENEIHEYLNDDSVDQIVDNEIQEYLDLQLGKHPKTKDNRRRRGRDRKGKYLMRSDSSSSSCSTATHSTATHSTRMPSTGMPLPKSSYTSLASLRRKKGSDNSAFTAFRRPEQKEQQQHQEQQQYGEKHKEKEWSKPKTMTSESSKIDDDWISFDNFRGSSYFANAWK